MLSEQDGDKDREAGAPLPCIPSLPDDAKEIVVAWFVTVINPMIEELKRQNDYLARRRYTWSYRAKDFEVIERLSDRIEMEYVPNFEHFIELCPDISALIVEHANHIATLQNACADLQHVLEHSSELEKLYKKSTEAPMLAEYGRTVDELFSADSVSDHLSYLAQLIINRIGNLQDYFTSYPLWNRFREEFIELLEIPAIRGYTENVDRAADELHMVGERLSNSLKAIRTYLAHKYRVPFVPPGIRT